MGPSLTVHLCFRHFSIKLICPGSWGLLLMYEADRVGHELDLLIVLRDVWDALREDLGCVCLFYSTQ